MKIGMSSYCLDREIEQGCMTLLECIDWAARQDADCLELVPFAFRFDDPATGKIDTALIKSVRRRAGRGHRAGQLFHIGRSVPRGRRAGRRKGAHPA